MRSVGEVGLQQSTTVDEFREVIGSMLEENQRLTHLIDSLLLLSKADSGRTALKIERHNINQLIAECIELLSILAEEKKLILTFVDTALIFAEVDKLLLRRALINLIDNAIKYTPQFGSVTISLEQKLNTVLINVQDTGIGIPQEHHEKLFDRFYRVDKDRSRETGGTGLGLAIVKWIVSVHGGSVSLKSLPKGSIFVLELPLRDQA
jgi:signal transduction histidine kinase